MGASLAESWAVPRTMLVTGGVILAVMLVPTIVAAVIAGPSAALPMLLAMVMCGGAATKLRPRSAVLLVAVVTVTSAVASALNGQPFVAACFAILVCLIVAPANTLDNGLLATVPAIASIYLASPALTIDPVPTALWTFIGGLVAIVLLSRLAQPSPLQGISMVTAYRHAAVMAVAVGVSVFLVLEFEVPHGYWVPTTMAFVLQPFATESQMRARARIWGTIGGSLLALVLAFLLPPWAIAVAILPLSLLSITYSLLARHGQAAVLLTPGAVLMANLASRDAAILATVDRLLATLVGGLAAAGLALFLERTDRRESEPAEGPPTQPAAT